jgi:hypothetical protein
LVPLLFALGCYRGADGAGDADGASADDDDDAGSADDGDASAGDDDGGGDPAIPPQPLHRLNRLEFNNTVRDLLGTELRPGDSFDIDPEANGFDNMADQLLVSAGLLDAYAGAARDTIADAIDERPRYQVRRGSTELGVLGGYQIGELWALSGAAVDVQVEVPEGGDGEIVLNAGISVVGTGGIPIVTLEVNGVAVSTFSVQGTGAIPFAHVFPMPLVAGTHHIRVIPTNYVNSPEINQSNNVFVESLTVRSIARTTGPGHELVYVCSPTGLDAQSCYEEIIEHFAFRAWRRPVLEDEQAELLSLFSTIQASGETPDASLRIVMRAIMLSPKFVYRARTTDDTNDGEWLDPYVLASRLSYFLWSSMPDDRLFDMAATGELATDEGLTDAVAWMLEDPKADALMDGFAEQWLSTRYLVNSMPNPEVYPGFDDEVRAAMTEESKLLFGDFLHNGEPAASIVQPSFAYINDRLATHYGQPVPGSAKMVRIEVGEDGRRGLLALGAWLTAQSDASHSSPIRRGRWVSDRLLCAAVPAPPAGLDVDPIEFDEDATVREQLEQHRNDENCSSCHNLLDVLGIGFEEYDGVARLRTEPDIDNLGELPDARTFNGAAELASLYSNSDVFVGCMTQKLFTYAVGRAPLPFDLPHLQAISGDVAEAGDDLPTLIDGIVHTPAFRSPAAFAEGE